MTTTYINLGEKNINFVAGQQYKIGNNLIITVNTTTKINNYVHGNNVNAYINNGTFTVVSGSVPADYNALVVAIATASDGVIKIIESSVATLAARDVAIAERVVLQGQAISALQASTGALIDDAATGTDKVFSASKTLALISTAKTELEAFANSAASGIIDDTSTGADKVLSASKITALLTALDTAAANYAAAIKTDLLSGADSAYDTLKEIQTFLEQNAGVLTALEQAGLNKVSFTELQSLSPEQKQTARTNIGAISSDEATTIANDRIAAVVGDPSTVSTAAIFASMPFTLA